MSASRPRGTATGGALDAALAVLLFAAVATYLAALPLNLSIPDEAHALLAAKRVGAGEVLYRDVFDVATPGWVYFMAALFGLFGCTLATARLAVAAIHAITAVVVFATCRRLDVRPALAWAAGLTYLVICQPMFPVASYHWLATALCTILVLLCLWPTDTAWRAFALGVVAGLLIAVHQQRGVVTFVGVAALLLVLAVLRWRYGSRFDLGRLLRQLAALAAGALVIAVPMIVAIVASAGIAPAWEALIEFPLVNYRTAHRAAHYGFVFGGPGAVPRALALFLRYLPLAAAASLAGALALAWRRRAPERARRLAVLAVLGGFAVASIMYYPDVIHIAFIAPLFFVAIAELVEWTLGLLGPGASRALGLGLAGAIVATAGVYLFRTAVAWRARYPVAYESAFGRIDLQTERQQLLWAQLRAELDAGPSRMVYAYPSAQYVHLLVDGQNATRFGLIVPSSPAYSPPAQLEEIVAALENKHVPFVVAGMNVDRADDAIARYIREHYEKIRAPRPLASILWRRRDEGVVPQHDGR